MEELTLTTPSILFSAISLIMLAYTNRFLAYATVIRSLRTEHEQNPTPMTQKQIDNLRKRLYMTRSMQIFGVTSLLLCVVCTLLASDRYIRFWDSFTIACYFVRNLCT